MTNQPGARSISVGRSAMGQFNTGDNSVLVSQQASESEALRTFVDLMSRELATITLTREQAAGTQAALAEINEIATAETVEPGLLRAAFARFVAFLADAGQPALTAVFMSLALNLGLAAPPA